MDHQDRDRFAAQLRAAGLRVTEPRVAVLGAIAARPHADATAVLREVRSATSSVSHQTVYDCLHTFTEFGLVRRIQPAGTSARYELRVGDNHHHLVCETCSDVVDIDCAVGTTPCLEPHDDHGYEIHEAEVIYWGTCPECSHSDQNPE